jgi:hypothetical protein
LLFRVYTRRRRDRRGRPWLLWWQDPPEGGAIVTKSIGPMTERLAEDHRILWQAELNGLRGDGGDGRLRWVDFEREYLEAMAVQLKRPSLAIARQTLKRFREAVRPRFLDQVDRALIERYRVSRLASVSSTTLKKDLATLRAAFGWAFELDYVAANPFDRLARRGREQQRQAELELEQRGHQRQTIWQELRCGEGQHVAGETAGQDVKDQAVQRVQVAGGEGRAGGIADGKIQPHQLRRGECRN